MTQFITKHLNADESGLSNAQETLTHTASTKALDIEGAHDDFDWSIDKKNVSVYSKEERLSYDKTYEQTFTQIENKQIINGTIVAITKSDVVVNIHYKSDGLIPLNEFRDMPHIKAGDIIEVMVVEKEDKNGEINISRRQAKLLRAWEKIVELCKTGEIVQGKVTSKTKGGLIVEMFGLETFLPGSQIDVKPITDYDQFVGKIMEFKVVKINEQIKNAVISHKALIEKDMEAQRTEIMGRLEKGQILEGVVKNITDFGAFMDLGGLDGLLYITDISWGRIGHPSEVLQVDQKIQVVVLDFDDDKKRISLGLKQLTPRPWDILSDEIKESAIVKGKLVSIEEYGAFIEIEPGVEGLIHVSEISWASSNISSKEFFKLGDIYEVKIITLDKENRKMSLSIKQLTEDPWNSIESKYPISSKHSAIVKNIMPYGVWVELEIGISGLIHVSDLSWLKRFNHPSEYVKIGQPLDIIILNIDKENRKLHLGHKQLEEDPWTTLEPIFAIGSIHTGTIVRKESNKGANVQLPYGLEGFCPARQLMKEDNSSLNNDDTASFMILEFDRNDKRIIVSHSKIWEQEQIEQKEAERIEKKTKIEKTKKDIKNIQGKIEKSTFGDIAGFSDILSKLSQDGETQIPNNNE